MAGKYYVQLDKYARVVIEDDDNKKAIYIEWNSYPTMCPFEFSYEPYITKDTFGEAMLIVDNDMDVYAAIEQARASWEI